MKGTVYPLEFKVGDGEEYNGKSERFQYKEKSNYINTGECVTIFHDIS